METTRKKIIMVDDDKTNLIVARNILIDHYDLITVASGEKLFGALEKIKPDLILLDIKMPEMDGYEIIKILKGKENTADIPVIFITGLTDEEKKEEGLGLGAIDYIYKPFSKELLLERLNKHFQAQSEL